jgi:hypothetical protein
VTVGVIVGVGVREGVTVTVAVAVAEASKGVDEGDSMIVAICVFVIVAGEQPANARTHMKETVHIIPLRNIRNPHPAKLVSF